MTLRNQKQAPRHVVLAEELLSEIEAGLYPIGTRFPTEHQLQERFQIGRHVIREALKLLTEQGLLGRRPKTGTLVLSQRPIGYYVNTLRNVGGLLSFAQSTRLQIADVAYITPNEGFIESIPIATGGRWLRVVGVRATKSDNRPLCWSELLVPEQYAPSSEALDRAEPALYERILQAYALKLAHVEQEVQAGALTAKLASMLEAEKSAPALLERRRYVATNGATFEISVNTYPWDRYSVRSIIRKRS